MDPKTAAQAEILENRLRKRFRHLRKWARRTGTGAFRLFDRDIPEIPLVLDFYGDVSSPEAAVSGALYARPYEKETGDEVRWLLAMTEAISRALNLPGEAIFLKERSRQRGLAQYEKQGERHAVREIRESGLRFQVNLSDYLDTGLFPDHRLTRAMVRAEAAEKRLLNLFSYTCAFSLYAASGGAREVDSVDLSNTYLEWGARNFTLNGIEARPVPPRALVRRPGGCRRDGGPGLPPYRLIRADVLRFLEGAEEEGLRWDLIVLDPPAFSNSKKMTGSLDLKRDHPSLIRRCLSLLNSGGKLWFSANGRNFRPQTKNFSGVHIEDIQERIRDEDFRGKRIPACYLFTKD
jgi:23S rRNA G2069 N7-methylase RlmK/C1962 C5-methylase RlmI